MDNIQEEQGQRLQLHRLHKLRFDGKVDAYHSVLAANPSPDFTLSTSSSSITLIKLGTGTLTVTSQSLNGFDSPITYSLQVAPSGVTSSFNPNPVTPTSGGSATSTLTLNVDALAASGSRRFIRRNHSYSQLHPHHPLPAKHTDRAESLSGGRICNADMVLTLLRQRLLDHRLQCL